MRQTYVRATFFNRFKILASSKMRFPPRRCVNLSQSAFLCTFWQEKKVSAVMRGDADFHFFNTSRAPSVGFHGTAVYVTFGELHFCKIKKWDAQNAWGVQKKCIEIFKLLKTIEIQFENVSFFAIAFPYRGCWKKSKFTSWRPWRAFFCASRNAWGSHFLWISEVPAHIRFDFTCCPKSVFVSSSFFKTSPAKVQTFLFDDSSAGMGAIFFIKIIEIHLALQIPIWKRSRGQKNIAF